MEAETENRDMEHAESLESRDNPFLPGGELSKEAEDLLSRATIIRDQFYLDERERRLLLEQQRRQEEEEAAAAAAASRQQQQEQQQQGRRAGKHVHIVEHLDGDGEITSGSPAAAVEERVCVATAANSVSAAPPSTSNGGGSAGHLENGRRVGEDDVTINVPGGDVPDAQTSPLPPTSSGGNNSHAVPAADGLNVHDSDKKKPRNKCCSVM